MDLSSSNSTIMKIVTTIKYLCPPTTASATKKPEYINQEKRLLATTERPLTAEELSKQKLFATVVVVCFCLFVFGIFLFVTYNYVKSKWDIIVREEKEEDEEMASLPEEDEGLLENNNKVKISS